MLEKLRDSIENLDKLHQINIFNILKESNVHFSENKNGIFINLSDLDNAVIDKLNDYLLYIKEQKIVLDATEKLKKTYKDKFFSPSGI